jgi:hypothetical protein
MPTQKIKNHANWVRFYRSLISESQNFIKPLVKKFKDGPARVRGDGFTLLVQKAQRRTLRRSAVVSALGEKWVRAHEKKTNFKIIRIVEDKK